jgi:hypothetical protein
MPAWRVGGFRRVRDCNESTQYQMHQHHVRVMCRRGAVNQRCRYRPMPCGVCGRVRRPRRDKLCTSHGERRSTGVGDRHDARTDDGEDERVDQRHRGHARRSPAQPHATAAAGRRSVRRVAVGVTAGAAAGRGRREGHQTRAPRAPAVRGAGRALPARHLSARSGAELRWSVSWWRVRAGLVCQQGARDAR